MVGTEPVRWLDEPLLALVPPPPPPVEIVAPGARLLAVHTPPGVPYRWTRSVALAWARMPSGGWAVLLAWESVRAVGDAGRRVAPRWSWCRFDRDLCDPLRPTAPGNPWGQEWHGRKPGDPLDRAVRAAVASLPEALRAAAVTPASVR